MGDIFQHPVGHDEDIITMPKQRRHEESAIQDTGGMIRCDEQWTFSR